MMVKIILDGGMFHGEKDEDEIGFAKIYRRAINSGIWNVYKRTKLLRNGRIIYKFIGLDKN